MSSNISRRILETKDDASNVVSRILKKEDTQFELVDFAKYNKTARLRSEHYHHFFVLCYQNSTRSAGWVVCRYDLNRSCEVEKSVFSFRSVQGGTNKL